MRNITLILLALLFFPFGAQSQTELWLELDGMYWQKYGLKVSLESNNLYRGTIKPWVGLNIGKSWSVGVLADYSHDSGWIPFDYNLPFGDREEFGSGITREGVRFLVQMRPF